MLLSDQAPNRPQLLIDAWAMAAVIGFLDRMGFLGFNPSVWAYFSTLFVSARRALRECGIDAADCAVELEKQLIPQAVYGG